MSSIERVPASIAPRDFYRDFVAARRPAIITGLLPGELDAARLTKEALATAAGEATVAIEQRDAVTHTFGTGVKRPQKFSAFLDALLAGTESVYLTTQPLEEDEDGLPKTLHASPVTELLAAGALPPRPALLGHLLLSTVNLWMGTSRVGTSSGLHHDSHDNLYCLLSGSKTFTIAAPHHAHRVYLHGPLLRVLPNGLINYRGTPTREDGALPHIAVEAARKRLAAAKDAAAVAAAVVPVGSGGAGKAALAKAKGKKGKPAPPPAAAVARTAAAPPSATLAALDAAVAAAEGDVQRSEAELEVALATDAEFASAVGGGNGSEGESDDSCDDDDDDDDDDASGAGSEDDDDCSGLESDGDVGMGGAAGGAAARGAVAARDADGGGGDDDDGGDDDGLSDCSDDSEKLLAAALRKATGRLGSKSAARATGRKGPPGKPAGKPAAKAAAAASSSSSSASASGSASEVADMWAAMNAMAAAGALGTGKKLAAAAAATSSKPAPKASAAGKPAPAASTGKKPAGATAAGGAASGGGGASEVSDMWAAISAAAARGDLGVAAKRKAAASGGAVAPGKSKKEKGAAAGADSEDEGMGVAAGASACSSKAAASAASSPANPIPDHFSRIPLPQMRATLAHGTPLQSHPRVAAEFPLFAGVRLETFDLHTGEMLYLPASWFHEVVSRSTGSSSGTSASSSGGAGSATAGTALPSEHPAYHLAVNYWYHPPSSRGTFERPYEDSFWEETYAARGVASNAPR